jgi:hypothetical protein
MHTGSQGHGSADPDLDQHQNIIFISSLSFVAVFGSGIRDPGSGMGKNQDPGSGINIPDPQHCYKYGL